MRAGFAKRAITPRTPCVLAGYAPTREMKGVHDELYVKSLFVEAEGNLFGYVAFDLLAVDHLLVDPIVDYLRQHGIQEENVLVTAIHTHSGPGGTLDTREGFLRAGMALMGQVDDALVSAIVSAAVECVTDALQHMEDGQMYRMQGVCQGVGSNRNSREFPGNNRLLCFEVCAGHRKMLVVHFACHPTVLNIENCLCSADFPGALQRYLEGAGYEMTLFLNGSCGDISTRFTRKSSGYDEVERCGKLLGDAILTIEKDKTPHSISRFRTKKRKITMKAKEPVPLSQAQTFFDCCQEEYEQGVSRGATGVEKRLLESKLEGAQADLRYSTYYSGVQEYQIPLVWWQINDDIFTAVPGELFSQLSNPIQDEHTHFIGYANGYVMYFADQNAYDQRYYEALSSPFPRGEAERMMHQIEIEMNAWRNDK